MLTTQNGLCYALHLKNKFVQTFFYMYVYIFVYAIVPNTECIASFMKCKHR